jgi:hypothetical protein
VIKFHPWEMKECQLCHLRQWMGLVLLALVLNWQAHHQMVKMAGVGCHPMWHKWLNLCRVVVRIWVAAKRGLTQA